MLVTTYQEASDFLQRVEATLLEHETLNSLLLGVCFRLRNNSGDYLDAPFLATVEDKQGLIVTTCMTPPHHLILTAQRPPSQERLEAFKLLIRYLQTQQLSISGCIAPADVGEEFAHLWQQETGQAYRVGTHERIFELREVTHPATVPGTLRLATVDDFETILRWFHAFHAEAVPDEPISDEQQLVQHAIQRGEIFVWEANFGHIVSMARKNRPVVNVISIGPVYTPPEERGKGYASNCVAALSQHLLDSGWQACSLFTDLTNPTSNHIYQKMGYRPLTDFNDYIFNL